MIAVDTNILVYAHREDSPFHKAAYAVVEQLWEGIEPWAIPWPCVHEFYAVVTNPRIYRKPTPTAAAIEQIETWMGSGSVVMLSESTVYWHAVRPLLLEGRITGGAVHDARIGGLCREHGVKTLYTADRDFSRFRLLPAVNPLVQAGAEGED